VSTTICADSYFYYAPLDLYDVSYDMYGYYDYSCYCESNLWVYAEVPANGETFNLGDLICSTCPTLNYDADTGECADDVYCSGFWAEYDPLSYFSCDPYFEDCSHTYTLYEDYLYLAAYDYGMTSLYFYEVADFIMDYFTCTYGYSDYYVVCDYDGCYFYYQYCYEESDDNEYFYCEVDYDYYDTFMWAEVNYYVTYAVYTQEMMQDMYGRNGCYCYDFAYGIYEPECLDFSFQFYGCEYDADYYEYCEWYYTADYYGIYLFFNDEFYLEWEELAYRLMENAACDGEEWAYIYCGESW
jgi:hypothetical protein